MKDVLAVKALNQYRKRDIFPYLGLRYYLEAKSGKTDHWINNVCIRLATDSDELSYLKTAHFKSALDDGYEHRDIYLPAPNEILAETALLAEVAKHDAFLPQPYVYSYRFARETDKSGVFQPYFNGFKERHQSIKNACLKNPKSIVFYTDIKKFYPSIKSSDAVSVWLRACRESQIEDKYRCLGLEILNRHQSVCEKDGVGNGILTGPLFSHFIANLLLDDIDLHMHTLTKGHYWRYVDDVVLLGSEADISSWRKILAQQFEIFGLKLHDGEKDFQVSSQEWLVGEGDLDDSLGKNWASFIGNLKRYLIAKPSMVEDLKDEFRKHHIRVPVIDYSNVVNESDYLERFRDWRRKYRWSARAIRAISIQSLVRQAKICEMDLSAQFKQLIEKLRSTDKLSIYETKRLIPKLRYLAGRLIYLLSQEGLSKMASDIEPFPDLYLTFRTAEALSTRNFSFLVQMGVNATHIACQLLRQESDQITIESSVLNSPIVDQALAVIELNGINHNFSAEKSELRSLAVAENIKALMTSSDGFIREFACLHGITFSRHSSILDTGFARDEALALDVLSQLQRSSHC